MVVLIVCFATILRKDRIGIHDKFAHTLVIDDEEFLDEEEDTNSKKWNENIKKNNKIKEKPRLKNHTRTKEK